MDIFLLLYIYAVVFIFGLCVGSYLNVLIYRIPRSISTAKGRSFCPDCAHTLRWYDLFPVLSYVFLGGRCRYCRARISPRYAAVELLNAVLWIAYAVKYFNTPLTMLAYFLFGSALICVIFIDAEHMLIYDRFSIAVVIAGLIIAAEPLYISDPCLYSSVITIWDRLIGAVCVSGVFFVIALISKGRAMGGGDIKLTAAAGLVLGWQNMLVMLVIASFAGTVGSFIQLAVQKHKDGKTLSEDSATAEESRAAVAGMKSDQIGHVVPFGPYLAGSMIIISFFGSEIVNLYLKLCGY